MNKLEAIRARRQEAGGTLIVRHGKQPKRYIGLREEEYDMLLAVAEAALSVRTAWLVTENEVGLELSNALLELTKALLPLVKEATE